MTWVEVSGKSLEDAKEMAAKELGVDIDQLEVEVLEEASKGFLGMGHPKVRIRAASPAGEAAEEHGDAAGPAKGERAVRFLKQILAEMGFDAEPVLLSEDDEEISIDIVGATEDLGRLIGRHGQTLDALQYIIGLVVNRYDENKVRIMLDTEGYRERHKQLLEAKAREYARQVKENNAEAVLEPQSPRDRRIVHMALADDPEIYTYSEGVGDERHVVISPKK